MPRFSVIVPAFRVQAYLHACLDSVLAQSFKDHEIIVVDDCSPDACGPIADEYARRDPRVTALHLPRNTGLGPARNAGMDRASGDYLIFLDGDDTLLPDALQTIADRIDATGEPDVLMYDYARTYWTGRSVRNVLGALLDETGPARFRLADRPELLRLLMVVWNKAYRRAFVEAEGFAFPPGYYEDTPWTYPVLMSAGSIAVLDAVCVSYRQRRRGNILSTTSEKHLDVFDQYDRVFAFIDSRPELAPWRPVIFRRMLDHFSALYASRSRLPSHSRAAFFRRATASCRRHHTPGTPVPRRARLRHGLLRLGARRTYRALSGAQRLGGRLRTGAAAVRRAVRGAALRAHYRIQSRLPLRTRDAVFTARGGAYAGSPAAIEAKVRELAPGMRTAWICRPADAHTVPTGTRHLAPGTFAHGAALARSAYLVNDGSFDRQLVKRRGQIVLQTHEGTPLRTVGTDLLDRPAAARGTDFEELLRAVDTWDYSLSANPHSTLVRERAYPSAYTTLEYGSPRNDVYHRTGPAEVARLRETLGVPEGTTALLYAPVPRDYRRVQRPALDLERLLRMLGPRFVVLARTPLPADPARRAPHPRIIDVSAHRSVETLALASDALITDYASLMFDYANLDRPVVLHLPDIEAYEASRGTYFDITAFPPGVVVRSQDELVDVLTTDHWRGSHAAQLRAAFRARFCPYDDGFAAERVVRRVFLGETDGLPLPVPYAARRTPAAALPAQDGAGAAVRG
ncbi:bifunctional glycosyltransferase family 2 protein/CDP-glycerol:glycerophosphate glycerophosphotransferase [Streptomyces sp. V2I9]|uniref:bifunctional glycosyltransferase/CDP-glycerol:glycerophosphate glycerophosphotransferase n=1 Tax=Streptomyces sp. V2I9 TaxID=3042304 RepID=UPI00278B210F|nr:bifunctional glycosyltransferase family 2 protein/CDP-glycerol:glycerophosphate glycerophosphotransferase [Streptomyces sp. V2I9]MDQ0984813.1 CDP-glycerol glycerophosphotransferase (TagB/SpsB family)/glycosyltransferase involved in cell wall biosynthesis [Streptomyces sp. V2I9]